MNPYKINYELFNDGDFSIALVDVSGNRNDIVATEKQKKGKKEINLNLSDYASGVYWLKITFNGNSESYKIILVK
jgi:hypothetical protein